MKYDIDVIPIGSENISHEKEKRITSFICGNMCPFCDNDDCNVEDIMEKYQSNWLSPSQMVEVNRFQLRGATCQNHRANEGFLMIAHKIEVYYFDGRVERKDGWYSSKLVAELWSDEVEYIEVLFSDV